MKDKRSRAASAVKTSSKGAKEIGIPLEKHIAFCIEAMRAKRRPRPSRQHPGPVRRLLIS